MQENGDKTEKRNEKPDPESFRVRLSVPAAQEPGRDCSFQSKIITVCKMIRQDVLTCNGDLNII